MSIEAFSGARAVREQYYKDRQALFAEGGIVKEPWTLTIPAITERNAPASIINGVCHTLLRGGHHFCKNGGFFKFRHCCPGKGTHSNGYTLSRVPFSVGTQAEIDLFNDKRSVVTHLCSSKFCINPAHMVLERHVTNSSRLSCPGPTMGCTHNPSCLIPGRNFKVCGHRRTFEKVFEGKQTSCEKAAKQKSADKDSVIFEISDDESTYETESAPKKASDGNALVADEADPEDHREVVVHAPAELKAVHCPIEEAKTELKRAQRMGNVELELEHTRILRLLLEIEKEKGSTTGKARTEAHKIDLANWEQLGGAIKAAPKTVCSSNRMPLQRHSCCDQEVSFSTKLGVEKRCSGGSEEEEQLAKKRARK